jgi:hypothetical protein
MIFEAIGRGCIFNITIYSQTKTIATYYYWRDSNITYKVKSKFHPKTSLEGPKGDWRYRSTLSLPSALEGGEWPNPLPN